MEDPGNARKRQEFRVIGAGMARHNRHIRSGFTLLEILLAIAIFALGGVAILALFIAQANRAKLAADANRSIEIAASVRAALEAAVQAPPLVIGKGETARYLYPLSIPFASLTNLSPRYGENMEVGGDTRTDVEGMDKDPVPAYFLELPKKPYRGNSANDVVRGETVMVYPMDLKDIKGSPVKSPRLGAGGDKTGNDLRVFYWTPDILSAAGKNLIGERIDNDDSDIYSFNFRIDRSVARTDIPDVADPSVKSLVPGLYVVRLRVYRGYDPAPNTPEKFLTHEFQFTIAATE